MGVFDKFLDIMRLSDEEDYEDDFFDEEEEGYQEKPAKNPFKKDKKEYDDFDVEEDAKNTPKSGNKVTPMRQPAQRRASGSGMEVCVVKPTMVDNAQDITTKLLEGRAVILNLEGLDLEIAQRIIDFTSGAAVAINGNLKRISTYIFLVTPTNVNISGDLQDLLNSSFDVPSINTRF